MDTFKFSVQNTDYINENNQSTYQMSNNRNKYISKITFEDVLNPFACYNNASTTPTIRSLNDNNVIETV